MQRTNNGGTVTLTNDTRTVLNTTKTQLDQLIAQVRKDIDQVQEPKAQALFETTAEVLIGLRKAYEDYTKGNEDAWR
jgi:hypothetical protein